MGIFDFLFEPEKPKVEWMERKKDVEGLIKAMNYKRVSSKGCIITYNIPEKAARALGRIGDERAIKPLLEVLKDSAIHSSLEREAKEALVKIGKPSVEPLIQILKDKDANYRLRRSAAEILGRIGDKRAIDPLIQALEDEDSYIRASAVKALGKINAKDKRVIKSLIKALKDEWEVGVEAAKALTLKEIDDERVVEPLLNFLRSNSKLKHEEIRKQAKKMADKKTYEELDRTIDHVASGTSLKTKAMAMAMMLLVEAREAIEPYEKAECYVKEALVKIGRSAVEYLIAVLRDEDQSVRKVAVEVLGKIGDSRAIRPLQILLTKDKDENVLKEAKKALETLWQRRYKE